MALEYPERDERAAFRRILEAASQFSPITAALAHLYGYTNPSAFERDMEAFLREMSGAVNDHAERIARLETAFAPHAKISGLAANIALQILAQDKLGRGQDINVDEFLGDLNKGDRERADDAISELKHLGYLEAQSFIGRHNARVSPTLAMYLAFDKAATGYDTRADAIEIAQMLLADPSTSSIPQLAAKTGWSPRRINPAVTALHNVLPDAIWSREINPAYAETYLHVTADERHLLQRLVSSGRVD